MLASDRVMIVLLALDSFAVAVGLMRKKNVWPLIVAYWIVLFVKNTMNAVTI